MFTFLRCSLFWDAHFSEVFTIQGVLYSEMFRSQECSHFWGVQYSEVFTFQRCSYLRSVNISGVFTLSKNTIQRGVHIWGLNCKRVKSQVLDVPTFPWCTPAWARCSENYIKVKKINYMLEIPTKTSLSWGVIFDGLGVQMTLRRLAG